MPPTHSKWDDLQAARRFDLDGAEDVTLLPFVQGYILALEDLLDDVDAMQYDAESMDSEYQNGHGSALGSVEFKIKDSLEQARHTLKALEEASG